MSDIISNIIHALTNASPAMMIFYVLIAFAVLGSLVAPADPNVGDQVSLETASNHPNNPRVYFDITMDGQPVGRILMELFASIVPHGTARSIECFGV